MPQNKISILKTYVDLHLINNNYIFVGIRKIS